jgi:hypothetical protein
MTFFSSYDKTRKRFTLTSIGDVGNPNVEEFEAKQAREHKVKVLEQKGHRVIRDDEAK